LNNDPDGFRAVEALAQVAQSGAPARWLMALGIGLSPLTDADWTWDRATD